MIDYTLALILPDSVQNQLAQQLCYGIPQATWIERESLHATLRQLGPLSSSELFEVKVAFREMHFFPFLIQLERLKYLPHTRKHGSLLLEIGLTEQLLQMKKECDHVLRKLKLPLATLPPHLLLGHCVAEEAGPYIVQHALFKCSEIKIEGCSLFSIHSSQKKIFYNEIEHYPASAPVIETD